ncbi:MAG: beta-galactosidase [Fimbriimonadaceae bacterium]|nr:beta-galactosidase [Fimbriimonadaceae bacterium]
MSERPTLIPGERRLLHGGDYNPDQWLRYPEVIDEDFRLFPEAGCNAFSVAIFAWSTLEPLEGEYRFGELRSLLDRFAEAGHKAILATPSAARPAWLIRKDPTVARVTREGLREPMTGRHNHCWSSPTYREAVIRMNTRLAEEFAGHPAVGMWHISNELAGECFCPLCIAAYQDWLKAKYGTLEALNDAWWSGFWSRGIGDWSEIEPREGAMDGNRLDWSRFTTWQLCEWIKLEAGPLRAANPDIPITVNLMGVFGPVDYAEVCRHVDLVADDQYPRYSPEDDDLPAKGAELAFKDDLHRCFKPDRPWMLMESCPDSPNWRHPIRLKRPGMHRLEMMQALAHGAEGTLYFQWRKGRGGCEKLHGAVIDHSATENTRVFRDVAAWGRTLAGLGDLVGQPTEPAECAVIFDWESRWAFNGSSGLPNGDDPCLSQAVRWHRALRSLGLTVDVHHGDRDWSGLKLVVAPLLWMLRPGMAERMIRFVEEGGVLAMTPWSAQADEFNRIHFGGLPGGGLRSLFGIWNEETDSFPLRPGRFAEAVEGNPLGLSGRLESTGSVSILHLEGAEAAAVHRGDFFEGTPAVTVRGGAVWVGIEPDSAGIASLADALTRKAGIATQALPGGVSADRRGDFLFLLNFNGEPVEFTRDGQAFRLEPHASEVWRGEPGACRRLDL